MERIVDELARRVADRYKSRRPGHRILVAVAGVPGSGKSTVAFPLVERINHLLGVEAIQHARVDTATALATPAEEGSAQIAVSVSLDGWHTSRADLDRMPNPVEARRRRGAAFTFDAVDYVQFVRDLRNADNIEEGIAFRTFDHAKKDPEINPWRITAQHQIVVIEGLYTLLDVQPWTDTIALFDEKISIDCPLDIARSRLIKRHIATGIEPDEASAAARVDGSDLRNAQYIMDHLATPTFTVPSVLDEAYALAVEHNIKAAG